jgi:hypothetical protein
MTRFYNRLMLGFTAVFVMAVAAAFGYQFLYVIPAQKCEAVGDWWEPTTRICATPIYLPHITGRPIDRAQRAAAAEAGLPEAVRNSPKVAADPRPAF